MALNPSEQLLLDYVTSHPEERQFWQEKVRAFARTYRDDHEAAARLETELWAYYRERSAVARPFRERVAREGLTRVSMRGLAEYWLRLWTSPKPKGKSQQKAPWDE
ncbi:MAG TPA: hypothetical protein PLN52_13025 [Opitutaceae bacterium]|nr:hypothetical protein [Opitutaceae bacterium]